MMSLVKMYFLVSGISVVLTISFAIKTRIPHPQHRRPAKFADMFYVFLFPVWQEIVFHEILTRVQQTNALSQTKLLCHNNTNQQKVCDVD